MKHPDTKIIIGGACGIGATFLIMLSFIAPALGDNESDYRIAENRKIIYEAQINAKEAHESLAKATEVVRVAVEAEEKAQAIVDAYSNTARTARENICKLSKEACTNANLDPAGQGVNVDEFFTLAR